MDPRSGSRGRRSARRPHRSSINTTAVYDYALRCAIRAFKEQSSGLEAPQQQLQQPSPSSLKGDRHSLHLSSMLDSLTEKFDKDNNTTDRLTRDIVSGLMNRLNEIRKGRDTSRLLHQDACFREVVSQFHNKWYLHRLRPSGTINDLVVSFLKISQAEIAKENGGQPNTQQLNRFMARFAELLIQTLKEDAASSSVTPELMERLNGFVAPTVKRTKSHYQHQRPTRRTPSATPPPPLPPLPGTNNQPIDMAALERFPMVMMVQSLFGVSDHEHRRKLRELQSICTDSAFLVDLKKCLYHIQTGQPFPGRREDYPNQQAYERWKTREVQQLSELIKTLMLLNPGLNQEETADATGARSNDPTCAFTFIPNFPRAYFRKLMEMCIDYDTNVISESERAKTSVLSLQSDELLRECWRTWRLSAPYRAVMYLDFVTERFEAKKLDIEDIKDAFRSLDKAVKESNPKSWATNDMDSMISAYEELDRAILLDLEEAICNYWRVKAEWVDDLVSILDKIYDNPYYRHMHPDPTLAIANLEEPLQIAAVTKRWAALQAASKDDTKDSLTNLLTLAEKLNKELVHVCMHNFRSSIKGVLDVPSVVMSKIMPIFTLEMDDWATYSPDSKNAPVDVAMELYEKVLSLKRLYDQRGPKEKIASFKVEAWFLQHVKRWLEASTESAPKCVENALKQEEFKPVSESSLHSFSVDDLFRLFNDYVDFVLRLQWPNEVQYCRFLTSLSKVIANALEQYTNEIEGFILAEFDILPGGRPQRSSSSSLLHKAKRLTGSNTSSTNQVSSRDITPELCIMLNDIEAARGHLDQLYQHMNVDAVAERMRELNHKPAPMVEPQTNFLYSIRILRGENLRGLDSNGLSDPYVSLYMNQKEIARTYTHYKTLDPRWDQSFDICLTERTADVLALVYDEDMIGSDQECGQVVFRLSPDIYSDYQSHELTLPLVPQGNLYMRISLVGEKDDIQFWFVKSFRTLKRAENDGASLIAEQMGHIMRQYLSRKVVDKLLKREKGFFSSFSSRSSQHIEPTLQECEDAIGPLLDYLEKNLKTLNDHLSETNMKLVITKIWNQVLKTIENLMRPVDNEPVLDDYEEHVVVKWLELLKILFNGGEDGDAVPLDKLENMQYQKLVTHVGQQRDSRDQRDSKIFM